MGGLQRILTGEILQDTYVIEGEIGSGGVGVVYGASHRRLSRKFAVKVLRPKVARDAEVVARFQREAELTSRLGHPHIIEIVDFNYTPSGAPYIVMERLQGEDLLTRLKRVGAMDLALIATILEQVCSALQAAHDQEIIHRDLKPPNIYLCRVGQDADYVKILDFGMSKIHGLPSTLTGPDMILGTPLYMSPEQAQGSSAAVDLRTDVFAMGAILYEMLSARQAFLGQTLNEVLQNVIQHQPLSLSQLRPELPAPVVRVVEQALAKRREDRFGAVLELSEAFQRALKAGEKEPAGNRTLPLVAPSVDPLGSTAMGMGPTAADAPAPAEAPDDGPDDGPDADGLDDLKTVPFEAGRMPSILTTGHIRQRRPLSRRRVALVVLLGTLGGALFVVGYRSLTGPPAHDRGITPRPTPDLAAPDIAAPTATAATRPDAATARPDAAPTATAATRQLWLTSEPTGARVLANGKPVGRTPLAGHPISVAPTRLVLRKPGYVTARRRLGQGTGPARLEVELKPKPPEPAVTVRLRVAASDGGEPVRNAKVLLNGVRRGKTPLQVDVPPGAYRVEVLMPGYRPAAKQVQLEPGKRTTTVIVDLVR